MADHDNIDAVMGEIEDKMILAQLEKRGTAAVCVAKVAGVLIQEAVAAGVPYSMAVEMAQDYWKTEMAPVEVFQIVGGEDE